VSWVLVAILVLPALGVVAMLSPLTRGRPRLTRLLPIAVTGVTLLLTLVVAAGFDYDHAGSAQDQINASWAAELALRFHLGVDGVSLPLLILTALLTCCGTIYLARPAGEREPRIFAALVLLLEVGALGSFLALDLLLFFVFFELVLVPMWALIRWWGGAGARRSATTFVLYTLLGSALMLTGFLVIYTHTGTLDMVALAHRHGAGMTPGTQVLAATLIGLGFAIKTPMWPLHSWLPDAHTAAPTVGSVLLAGVLLKMGTYGFVRVILADLPTGAHRLAPALAGFAAVGIVYGALACLAQVRSRHGDLKRLIAFSSVGHMGFVLLGIATLTPVGVNGALFANIAHGLITGLLFFLAGGLKERQRGTSFADLGRGLYRRSPRYGALLAFAAFATLGSPGLAGFWGEALALFGAARPAAGLPRAAYWVPLVVAGVGMVVTAAYALGVVRRVCMGDEPVAEVTTPGDPDERHRLDPKPLELAGWLPLAGLTVVAGLWPAMLLGLSNPAVHTLLAGR
jgi:NADH-quinone oxidoreductase subunit M